MKRIVIIFSSLSKDTGEYYNVWVECWLNLHPNEECSSSSLRLDGHDWNIYVFNGCNVKYHVYDSVGRVWHFEALQDEVIRIIAENQSHNPEIAVLLHGGETELNIMRNGLSSFKGITFTDYSRAKGNFYEYYIEPFGKKGNVMACFENLWKELQLMKKSPHQYADASNFNVIGAISSLDILLQGYLIIRSPKFILGNNFSDLMEEYAVLQEGSDQKKEALKKTSFHTYPEDQRLFRPKNIEANPAAGEPSNPQDLGWFWFDECLPDLGETPYESLIEKCAKLSEKSRLRELWNLLRGECLGKPDGISIEENCEGWTQDDFTIFFQTAHREYASIFE